MRLLVSSRLLHDGVAPTHRNLHARLALPEFGSTEMD
jgi:hypothetical protein